MDGVTTENTWLWELYTSNSLRVSIETSNLKRNDLVKECICFSHGSVLINGEISGYFAPSCGLRQGNPLSPFLFIIAEEFLSLNISKLVNEGSIKPIFSSISCPPIYHLMFADDILIFFSAILSNAAKLAKLLSLY